MPTLHELNCLVKGTFMWSHSRWCVFVGCRNIHLGLLRPRPPNFPTHVDAFISNFGGFRCISWCGLVCSFLKKKNKKALGVLFCIFAFFVQYWARVWGRGVGRAVVLLFSCEANSEKVLYCRVQSWPPPVGLKNRFLHDTRHGWSSSRSDHPDHQNLITPACVVSSLQTGLLLAHSRKAINLWLDRRPQKSWGNLKMSLNTT